MITFNDCYGENNQDDYFIVRLENHHMNLLKWFQRNIRANLVWTCDRPKKIGPADFVSCLYLWWGAV